MCAISGIIRKNTYEKSTESIINMVKVQAHRGPDDCGICGVSGKQIKDYSTETIEKCETDTSIVLGHNRLSILDLSALGHQPMKSSDGSTVIVYNGEIYNAFEEREKLAKKGHIFRSHTDTEVILALYQECGIDETLRRLNGMFSFCLYDIKSKTAYIARDRFGIKPLYYYEDKEILIFASEIKAIVKSNKMNVVIDNTGFQEIFVFGMSYCRSIVSGIKPLRPGTYIVWDGNNSTTNQFFNIDSYSNGKSKKLERNKAEGKAVLKKSVENQMISDVRLGCQLSGGVDSSLVSYFASKSNKSRMTDSIAVIFDDQYKELNEEKYIDYVSDKLGIDCHKNSLEADFFIENIEKINWYLDNIPAYYNELGILLLSKEAKKYVTVLLSGEGADELFAGYTRMAYSGLISVASKLNALVPKYLRDKIWKGRSSNRYVDYIVFKEAVPLELCCKVFDDYIDEEVSKDRIDLACGLKGDSLDIQRKYEMSVRLQGLLNRQDKSTMANSIENRVPILDNDVVDWAFSLSYRNLIKVRFCDLLKKRGTRIQGKYILKSICAEMFGKDFAYRDKGGFGIPCRDYIKNEIFKKYVDDVVLPGIRNRNLMNYECISNWFHSIDTINALEENALWRALNLEILCQLLVDGREYRKIA